jgi:hypothetical protein
VRRFRLPAPALIAVMARKANHRNLKMTSPYLDRPVVPLAEALPQMLAKIEAELSTAVEPAEEQWLRQRAELIRGLLAPRLIT